MEPEDLHFVAQGLRLWKLSISPKPFSCLWRPNDRAEPMSPKSSIRRRDRFSVSKPGGGLPVPPMCANELLDILMGFEPRLPDREQTKDKLRRLTGSPLARNQPPADVGWVKLTILYQCLDRFSILPPSCKSDATAQLHFVWAARIWLWVPPVDSP